jgi:hypothetical protein
MIEKPVTSQVQLIFFLPEKVILAITDAAAYL